MESLKIAQEGNINLKHPLNSHLVIKILFFLIGAMYDCLSGFSCMSVIRGTFFVGKKSPASSSNKTSEIFVLEAKNQKTKKKTKGDLKETNQT